MEGSVIKQNEFKLFKVRFREFIQKQLKTICIAIWQFQFEMITCERRICAEQIQGLKHLLKRTYRLNAFGCQPFPVAGEHSKPTLILAKQVYFCVSFCFIIDDILAFPTEVFLKASTASGDFFTCTLRATLIFALNFLTTNP